MRSTPTKTCARCGRRFSWRAKWARHWDSVRYCGERCRRRRLGALDRELERAMRQLLEERGRKTICPSEVARQVAPLDWRKLMEPTREAARRLVARGEAEILQRGRVIDPSSARGPIRVRVKPGAR